MIKISRWTAFAVSGAAAAAIAVSAAVHAAPGAETAQARSSLSSEDDFQETLDDLVKAEVATAVLLRVLTAGGEWSGAAGVSDGRTGRPADPAGYFRIGSVTETVAATVLLQLVDEGRLRLDDPVAEHLPGVVPDGDRITCSRRCAPHTPPTPVSPMGWGSRSTHCPTAKA